MINYNEEDWGFISDDYEPLIGDDQGLDFLGSEFTGA